MVLPPTHTHTPTLCSQFNEKVAALGRRGAITEGPGIFKYRSAPTFQPNPLKSTGVRCSV